MGVLEKTKIGKQPAKGDYLGGADKPRSKISRKLLGGTAIAVVLVGGGIWAWSSFGDTKSAAVSAVASVTGVSPETAEKAVELGKAAYDGAGKLKDKVGDLKERAGELKGAAIAKGQQVIEERKQLEAERQVNVAESRAVATSAGRGSGFQLQFFAPTPDTNAPDAHQQKNLALPTRWTLAGVSSSELGTQDNLGVATALLDRAMGGIPEGTTQGTFAPGQFGIALGGQYLAPCTNAGLTCLYFQAGSLATEDGVLRQRAGHQQIAGKDVVIGIPPIAPSVEPQEDTPARRQAVVDRLQQQVVNRVAGEGSLVESVTWLSPYEDVALVQTHGVLIDQTGKATSAKLSILATCAEDQCRPFAFLPVTDDFAPSQRVIEAIPYVGQLAGVYAINSETDTGEKFGHLNARQWVQAVVRTLEISGADQRWGLAQELKRIADAKPDLAGAISMSGGDLNGSFAKFAADTQGSHSFWNWTTNEMLSNGFYRSDQVRPFVLSPITCNQGTCQVTWEFRHEVIPGGGAIQLPKPISGTLTFAVRKLGPGVLVELVQESINSVDLSKVVVSKPRG